jgi:hypothetical protein
MSKTKIEDFDAQNWRAYSLNNMYLSGIHAGNQSAHSHDEVTLKYLITSIEKNNFDSLKTNIVMEYIKNHKTMIVLNGGMHGDLMKTLSFLKENEKKLDYPFAEFHESEYALNGALTNITIILPDKIFKYSRTIHKLIQKHESEGYTTIMLGGFEYKIAKEKNKYRMTDVFSDISHSYSEEELELMNVISKLNLM